MTRVEYDFPAEDYHKSDGVSSGQINAVMKTPLDYLYYKKHGIKVTPNMRIGSAVHCAVLEGTEALKAKFALEPRGLRGKNNSSTKELASWKKENEAARKTIIERSMSMKNGLDDCQTIGKCIAALHKCSQLMTILEDGNPEVSCWWRDELTELTCKARADWIRGPIIVDLKMMARGTDERSANSIVRERGVFRQQAHYCNGLGTTIALIGAFDPMPPFKARLFRLQDSWLQAGYIECQTALKRITRCNETGEYPGWPDKIESLEKPGWYKERFE